MAGALATEELNQLEEIILHKVQQRTPPRMNEDTYILKQFRFHDFQGQGLVDFGGFLRSLQAFTAGIAEEDLRYVFDRYAQGGVLSYRNFASEFVSGVRRTGGDDGGGSGELWESIDDTILRMRHHLYTQGPQGIIGLCGLCRDNDPQNSRSLPHDFFQMVLKQCFGSDGPCPMTDDRADQVFQAFRQQYAPNLVAYDEFLAALREEPTPQRRAAVRAAFQRLDKHSEGLVDINEMVRCFNANRHPDVADRTREAPDVLEEFATTLRELVCFRRGSQSYPTNLVAWEEFNDYYQLIAGCFENDAHFCSVMTKVWDLDKVPDVSADQRAALSMPAAGLNPPGREGLHHRQANTLPINQSYKTQPASVKLENVVDRAQRIISTAGVGAAINLVKNFYQADDDVDDLLDVYEFRGACAASRMQFKDVEEQCLFEAYGDGCNPPKLRMLVFLDSLFPELPPRRRRSVEQAFHALGGDPSSPESAISPGALKDRFDGDAHPMVHKGQADPGKIQNEFLDTFSLLAHVRGGCQEGMVAFSDFSEYYRFVSPTMGDDVQFDVVMRRLWGLAPDGQSHLPPATPASGGFPLMEKIVSPMAGVKPPAFSGPSVYGQDHRRFPRKELPLDVEGESLTITSQGPFGACMGTQLKSSAITKGSLQFNQPATESFGHIVERLRESIRRRGLGGWRSLVAKFEQFDNARNGSILRMDWERMHKTLGLGLSPEERDGFFKALSHHRKDGRMDYMEGLRYVKGGLSEERMNVVLFLFDTLKDGQGMVQPHELQSRFDASHTPAVIMGKRTLQQAIQEFQDATDFFGERSFTQESFVNFFSMISVLYDQEHDFIIMASEAFGTAAPN